MKSQLAASLVLLVGLLMLSGSVFAHHGTAASYDQNRVTTVRGIVTEFVWSNPHSQLYFDVKDDQGNVTHWGAELHSPSLLTARGWTKTCIKPGEEIIIIGNPSKTNAPVMQLRSVKDLATGMVYYRELPGTQGEVKDAFQKPGN